MRWKNAQETREDVIDRSKLVIDQAVNMASESGDPDLIKEMFGHWSNIKRLFPTNSETYEGMRRSRYASALRILEYTGADKAED
jgi:hypothetical protein